MLMEFYDSRWIQSHRVYLGHMNHEVCVKCLLKIQSSPVAAAGTFYDVPENQINFSVYLFKFVEII